VVTLTLKTETLNNINVDLLIHIEGYHQDERIMITAESQGPIVHVNKEEIDFGNVAVLEDVIHKITLRNACNIKAEYTAFTKNKSSIWKVI